MRALFLLTWLFLGGCRHQVRIESTPPGANVYLNKEKLGDTPLNHKFTWYPRKQVSMRIQLPGYRSVNLEAGKSLGWLSLFRDIALFRYRGLFGMKPRKTCHVLMIRNHGKAGTWTPADAKKNR